MDGYSFGKDRKHVNPPPWIFSSEEPCEKVMILLSVPLDVIEEIFARTPSACLLIGRPSRDPQFCRIIAVQGSVGKVFAIRHVAGKPIIHRAKKRTE